MEAIARSIEVWLTMGGYAAFVWPAYAVTAAVLGGLAFLSWRRHRASSAALARVQHMQHQTGGRE
jgi:heme exporter protein D